MRKDPRKELTRKRKPLGGIRQKLAVENKDDAYVYRWVAGMLRARSAIEGGYEPVLLSDEEYDEDVEAHTDPGQWVSRPTGREEQGNPQISYLMRIRREWYDEDQAMKSAELDRVDAAIYGKDREGHEPGTTYAEASVENQFKR